MSALLWACLGAKTKQKDGLTTLDEHVVEDIVAAGAVVEGGISQRIQHQIWFLLVPPSCMIAMDLNPRTNSHCQSYMEIR